MNSELSKSSSKLGAYSLTQLLPFPELCKSSMRYLLQYADFNVQWGLNPGFCDPKFGVLIPWACEFVAQEIRKTHIGNTFFYVQVYLPEALTYKY